MVGKAKKPAAPKKKANGYKMPPPIPQGEVIDDPILKKKWRIGPSIGVGGFGEIYSACDDETSPKKTTNFPYVIKIEPHENGPLFVEKHFYVRNANKDDITNFMKARKLSSFGMPGFYGSGSHDFQGAKYRFLVLERYGKDVWKMFIEAGRSFPAPVVFQIGLQMLDVLEYIHSRGYIHADLKGANILMGLKKGTENQAYLVDFGLALRITEKEFKPDPKCAHDGTIEYTSRDAHLGSPTMRGDLEILAYNLLQWIVGTLPWETVLKQPNKVQALKEDFMQNARKKITKDYPNVPEALIKFFEYVNTLKPRDEVNFAKCRQIFESYLKSEGKTRSSKLDFTKSDGSKTDKPKARAAPLSDSDSEDEVPLNELKAKDDAPTPKKRGRPPKVRRGRKPKPKTSDGGDDVETSDASQERPPHPKRAKSHSTLLKVKKPKLMPKVTPPAKKNHAHTATQTSGRRESLRSRHVAVDDNANDKTPKNGDPALDTSRDIFEDSFEVKKEKPKRKLISTEEYTETREVRKKVTTVKKDKKEESWRDAPAIANGRGPPEIVTTVKKDKKKEESWRDAPAIANGRGPPKIVS